MLSPNTEVFGAIIHSVATNATTRTRSRRHTWGHAPAHEGRVFLETFVEFRQEPPEPIYKPESHFGSKSTLGYFDGTDIYLKDTLRPNQERWVAMHELMHWAGFGQNKKPLATTQKLYRDETKDGAVNIRFDLHRMHWDTKTMTGAHLASGLPGSAEVMNPVVQSMPFLSAATLNELSPQKISGRQWCTSGMPCRSGPCAEINPYVPRHCASMVSVESAGGHPVPSLDPNAGEVSDDAALGIILGSVLGTAFIVAVVWKAGVLSRGSGTAEITEAWLLMH